MDLRQMIRADHANVWELCREILGRGDVASRERLFDQLERELDRHMRVTDLLLGPALRRFQQSHAYSRVMEYEHEAIRRRLDELAHVGSKDTYSWTRRFEDLLDVLERTFDRVEDQILPALRTALWPEEEEALRHAFEREKIVALQAQRWHLPAAVMPRRYGVSNRAVLGVVAGAVAAAAVTAAWRSPLSRRERHGRQPGRLRARYKFPTVRRTAMRAHEIISTHPDVRGSTNDALIRCIEECYSCAQVCTSCADACLAEDMVQQLRQCIRLDLDCADVCAATGSVTSRRTGSNEEVIRRMLEACETACRLCAEECERHAGRHEHCRICAESCRRCEQACREALRSMAR